MPRAVPAALWAALCAALAAGAALAAAPPAAWMELALPAKARNVFTHPEPGMVRVASDHSVSFLYRPVTEAERGGRALAWRWRVNRAPAPTDLTMAGMDDRPLAVHVWFGDAAAPLPLGTALARLLGLAPEFPRGRLITYVWGGIQDRGTAFANPYPSTDGAVIVLRCGTTTDTGRWFDERVDLAADFRRVFGAEMPPPTHLAISADTDDKGGASLGSVAGLAFQAGDSP
ncbi:MAG: DUF3047 domain-containing protein [Hyphomicrobiales bacterium]|nr:DUF3047 domain-containing protein [Hyphomicrobiales bacterium]MCP5370669.1 DUF3047 domain-containing protein [Hyphomicrobiales bacterium]